MSWMPRLGAADPLWNEWQRYLCSHWGTWATHYYWAYVKYQILPRVKRLLQLWLESLVSFFPLLLPLGSLHTWETLFHLNRFSGSVDTSSQIWWSSRRSKSNWPIGSRPLPRGSPRFIYYCYDQQLYKPRCFWSCQPCPGATLEPVNVNSQQGLLVPCCLQCPSRYV